MTLPLNHGRGYMRMIALQSAEEHEARRQSLFTEALRNVADLDKARREHMLNQLEVSQ